MIVQIVGCMTGRYENIDRKDAGVTDVNVLSSRFHHNATQTTLARDDVVSRASQFQSPNLRSTSCSCRSFCWSTQLPDRQPQPSLIGRIGSFQKQNKTPTSWRYGFPAERPLCSNLSCYSHRLPKTSFSYQRSPLFQRSCPGRNLR